MSIELSHIMASFQRETAKSVRPGVLDPVRKDFEQLIEENSKIFKSLDVSVQNPAEAARLAQLRMLQGLFMIEGEEIEADLFDRLGSGPMRPPVPRTSQIVDRYYAEQQPSLREPVVTGRSGIDRLIDQVAERVSLAPELIRSVVSAESGYDPTAQSRAGAQGLMQLMPETARELGVRNSFDPMENLLGGSRYLKQLLDKYAGDLDHALAAYNWGQGNVDRHGLENMPEETRNYLTKIKNSLKESPV